jgi:hypothetical protein
MGRGKMTTIKREDGTEVEISFNEDQQKYINEFLIKDAMGRAGKEARTKAEELERQVQELNGKIGNLNTELDTARKAGKPKDSDEAKALKEEFERVAAGLRTEADNLRKEAQKKAEDAENARKELLNTRKRHTILSAASKVGFHDIDAVVKLTEDNIDWDDDKKSYIVRGENGEIRHNSAMRHMTLEEFYTDYASKKPWLANGQMKGGSGTEHTTATTKNTKFSVEEIFGSKADSTKAMKLKRENPQEYQRLKQIAREAHLIA